MFAFIVYAWPKELTDCWRLPIERAGLFAEELPTGGIVRAGRTKVKLLVGKDGCATIYGWSFSWTKRQKLAESVERILMASGMQALCKPHSTNLIYRLTEQPGAQWLERVKPKGTEMLHQPDATSVSTKEQSQGGWIKSATASIRFWTGPAIDPESKRLVHYLAFDADAASASRDTLLKSLDSALAVHGATRLETQRKLDR